MTTTVEPALAGRLEAAVLATPGVRSVYRAGSLVSNLVGESANAIGITSADEPLVAVRAADGGASVQASLGIEYSARAIETLRAVREAIEAVLVAEGLTITGVTLTIAYVHPREASTV